MNNEVVEVATDQDEITLDQKLNFIEQYLKNAPRKVRRAVKRDTFSERFKKTINSKKNV